MKLFVFFFRLKNGTTVFFFFNAIIKNNHKFNRSIDQNEWSLISDFARPIVVDHNTTSTTVDPISDYLAL